jgi:hypothetical protein
MASTQISPDSLSRIKEYVNNLQDVDDKDSELAEYLFEQHFIKMCNAVKTEKKFKEKRLEYLSRLEGMKNEMMSLYKEGYLKNEDLK